MGNCRKDRTGETDGVVTFTGTSDGTTVLADVALGLDDALNIKQQPDSAYFTLDGFPERKSESNTITEALPGVTIELKGATSDTAKITISSDTEPLAERLNTFVESYNEAMQAIDRELTTRNTENLDRSLFGDATLRQIKNQITQEMTQSIAGLTGAYTSASSVGVEIDRYGTLSFDRTTLDDALSTDSNGVNSLLRGTDSITGLLGSLGEQLEYINEPREGLIALRRDGISDQVRDLDDQIRRTQTRIDDYQSRLESQFTHMESMISSLEAQRAQLNAMLG